SLHSLSDTPPVSCPPPACSPFPYATLFRSSPATVFEQPPRASVTDSTGTELAVTARHRLTAAPCHVAVWDEPGRWVRMWAGPWPVGARWWDPHGKGALVRIQIVLSADMETSETALLLRWEASKSPQWLVEGVYD